MKRPETQTAGEQLQRTAHTEQGSDLKINYNSLALISAAGGRQDISRRGQSEDSRGRKKHATLFSFMNASTRLVQPADTVTC